MNRESLRSYDDCFYAEKGIEMGRRGGFFTVTWSYRPTFQNPPLQSWLLGRSFAAFGENDFAARLPSLLMAVGILLMTYRIGRLTFGRPAGLIAVAALMLTPIFVMNARRCMMEIPLTFWTTAALLVYIEGLEKPRLHALFAVPLAGAVLTKSVLGLLPVLIVAGGVVAPRLRRCLRNPWLWLGILAGLAAGASWTIHQTCTFGTEFLKAHYLREILSRSTKPLALGGVLTAYPLILIERYQPVILAALAGMVLFARRRISGEDLRGDVPAIWVLLPLVLYSFSGARNPRYVFPLLPALAVFSGYLLSRKLPRMLSPLCCYVVPLVSVLAALLFWFAPTVLVRDSNQVYKQHIELARAQFPPGTDVPYLGGEYWPEANPLIYYWGVRLERSSDSPDDAVRAALARPHRSLICVRDRLVEIADLGVPSEVVVEGKGWAWLRFADMKEAEPSASSAPSVRSWP